MYEFLSHTADVRVRVEAPTAEELFAESLRALGAFVQPGRRLETRAFDLAIEAPDLSMLLVDFLNEALWRLHARSELYERALFESLERSSVRATLVGAVVAGFDQDVKAVTYHEVNVQQVDGAWSTLLVFDI